MSTQEIRKVISRAVTEEEFRKLLFSAPATALANYDLTETEKAALKTLPAEPLEVFALQIEDRISLSVLLFAAEGYGGVVIGGEVYGGEAMGEDAFGSEAYNAGAMGGEGMDSQVMGGDGAIAGPGPAPAWLARLFEALGVRHAGNAPHGIKYY